MYEIAVTLSFITLEHYTTVVYVEKISINESKSNTTKAIQLNIKLIIHNIRYTHIGLQDE